MKNHNNDFHTNAQTSGNSPPTFKKNDVEKLEISYRKSFQNYKNYNVDLDRKTNRFSYLMILLGFILFAIIAIVVCAIAIPNMLNGSGSTTSNGNEIIIPLNIPKGEAGCSNYPLQAPKNSSHHSLDFRLNTISEKNNICGMRYTITECDLLSAMYENGLPSFSKEEYLKNVVRKYLRPLIQAMEIYDLNCSPNRIAFFLAALKHETASLTIMKNPTDGGAGGFHVLPVYFPRLLVDIPALYKEYKAKLENEKPLQDFAAFAASSGPSDPFMQKVGDMIALPDFTFLVAGWWVKYGATKFQSCSDLRITMDGGGNNFDSFTKCIFGSGQDLGQNQRIAYYQSVAQVSKNWKCQTKGGCEV
jgi:hypothetical protein